MTGHTSPPPSAALVLHAAVGLAPVKKKRKPRRWLRTRDREHLQMLNLQLDINSLSSEIRALDVTRALLAARALQRRDAPDGAYVRTVHEYFSKLRHGYADPRVAPSMASAQSFLYAMLDADVAKGHLRGIASCVQMIALYTAAFGPVVHELQSASVHVNPNEDTDNLLSTNNGGSTVLVRARTRYTTTIVPQTFAIIFPRAPLGLQAYLIGQRIEGYGQFDIVFDTVSHRVVRFDMEFDFLPAFAKVLPHPRDLALLFNGARVATDCCIGDDVDESLAPPQFADVDDSSAHTTDDDTVTTPSSTSSSPARTRTSSSSGSSRSSPSRSMALQSILNEDEGSGPL